MGCKRKNLRATHAGMSTPQDAPTRKKQKIMATRKLAEWRKKQAETQSGTKPTTPTAAAKKK
jgi:hypothetical protein